MTKRPKKSRSRPGKRNIRVTPTSPPRKRRNRVDELLTRITAIHRERGTEVSAILGPAVPRLVKLVATYQDQVDGLLLDDLSAFNQEMLTILMNEEPELHDPKEIAEATHHLVQAQAIIEEGSKLIATGVQQAERSLELLSILLMKKFPESGP